MAKNLALLALLLGVASLFLPLSQVAGMTKGVLAGDLKEPVGAMFMAPATFAALFGATLGRKAFRRGLGTLHLLFGLAGLGLVGMLFGDERIGGDGPLAVQLGMGTYAAGAGAALVFIAGLIGLIKPDPKV